MSQHTCHWIGCQVEVPPRFYACRPHWFRIPAHLRAKIWRTYRKGQEIDKNPSEAYVEAALEVRQWILAQQRETHA